MLGSSMLKGTEDPTKIGTRKEHGWTLREMGCREDKYQEGAQVDAAGDRMQGRETQKNR